MLTLTLISPAPFYTQPSERVLKSVIQALALNKICDSLFSTLEAYRDWSLCSHL